MSARADRKEKNKMQITITLNEEQIASLAKFRELATIEKRKNTRFSRAAEVSDTASVLVCFDYGVTEKVRHFEKQAQDSLEAAEKDAKVKFYERIKACGNDTKKIAAVLAELETK